MRFLLVMMLYFGVSLGAHAQTCATPVDPGHIGVPYTPYATGSYYDWGKAQDGWAYCYEWAVGGGALNDGQPVDNGFCEAVHPSYYNWGRAQSGFGYCYQWSPYGVAMNEGQPVDNGFCEAVRPSYYSWGRGQDGMTRCYQYTANGVPMNEGQPVDNGFCGG